VVEGLPKRPHKDHANTFVQAGTAGRLTVFTGCTNAHCIVPRKPKYSALEKKCVDKFFG
jgi:hypothetical protein